MKIRTDFVSNSSSCSIIVNKHALEEWQKDAIRNHIKYANEELFDYFADDEDGWGVEETSMQFRLSTSMDNFMMANFLNDIGVPRENIRIA